MTYTPVTAGTLNWDVPVNAAFTDQDTRITTNASNITSVTNRATALETLTSALEFQASDHAAKAWAYDPTMAVNSTVLTSGSVQMSKVILRAGATISTIYYNVSSAGVTLTAGQNFVGLYDAAGNQVGVSADQAANWTSTGQKTTALVTPAVLAAGSYCVAILSNGTTPPGLARATGQGTFVNFGLTTTTARYTSAGIGWTGLTSLPASGNFANRALSSTPLWFAIA